MRGKLLDQLVGPERKGNIPAYAGKTPPSGTGRSKWREHPRVCGENSLLCELRAGLAGTSPRMRGKLWGWWF